MQRWIHRRVAGGAESDSAIAIAPALFHFQITCTAEERRQREDDLCVLCTSVVDSLSAELPSQPLYRRRLKKAATNRRSVSVVQPIDKPEQRVRLCVGFRKCYDLVGAPFAKDADDLGDGSIARSVSPRKLQC